MKGAELRIGNLIYWDIPEKQGVPHVVIGILERTLRTVPISIPESMYEYKPIPLTTEILEKCGFIQQYKEHPESFWSFKDQITIFDESYVMQWRAGRLSCVLQYFGHAMAFKCEYIHELQNIYFTLTNAELPVDL